MLSQTALQLLELGIQTTPIRRGSKAPSVAGWQHGIVTLENAAKLFEGAGGIGVVCGAPSGNLECLDFDQGREKGAGRMVGEFRRRLRDHGRADLAAVLNLAQQTPSGGWHLIYRCDGAVEGSQKLAMDAEGRVRIETRGAGGQFVAAPSPGYALRRGDWGSVPVVSAEDREFLLNVARTFHEAPRASSERVRVGDDFNLRGPGVAALLLEAGWTRCGSTRGGATFTRPGKSARLGPSGTVFEDKSLFVHSSNAAPFASGESYSAFGVVVALRFGGDYRAAARELAGLGFGATAAPSSGASGLRPEASPSPAPSPAGARAGVLRLRPDTSLRSETPLSSGRGAGGEGTVRGSLTSEPGTRLESEFEAGRPLTPSPSPQGEGDRISPLAPPGLRPEAPPIPALAASSWPSGDGERVLRLRLEPLSAEDRTPRGAPSPAPSPAGAREGVLRDSPSSPAAGTGPISSTKGPKLAPNESKSQAASRFRHLVKMADEAPLEVPEWLGGAEGVLRVGQVNLIAAAQGVGKSTFALAVAHAGARGRNIFGAECAPFHTLYIGNEDSAGEIRHACERLFGSAEGLHIIDDGGLRLERETIRDIGRLAAELGVKFVFIDPVAQYFPSYLKLEFDNPGIARLVGDLREMAQEHDLAIGLVRHFTKSTVGKAVTEMAAGGAAWAASCRSVLVMLPHPDPRRFGRERYVGVFPRRGSINAPRAAAFGFSVAGDVFGWIRSGDLDREAFAGKYPDLAEEWGMDQRAGGQAPLIRTATAILAEELAEGPVHFRELREKVIALTGCSERTVYHAKKALKLIDDNGYWRLPISSP